MNKKDEMKRKIDDLNRQMEYNNQSNKRMLDQLNLLETELMIIQRPQITEAEFERLVHDMSDLMSDILHDVSANVNDYTMDFEIGYNNEVTLSDISLDYDATDDIKNILETRFDIGPDQTTDEDTK